VVRRVKLWGDGSVERGATGEAVKAAGRDGTVGRRDPAVGRRDGIVGRRDEAVGRRDGIVDRWCM